MCEGERDYPVVVAEVWVGNYRRKVRCNSTLRQQEANLLFVLGEHVSRPIPIDDICHRMRISHADMKVHASNIRKKLHYDWIIDTVPNRGLRLCYIGTPLSDAGTTNVQVAPVIHGRVGLKHDLATKEKIRSAQIRNESWLNFHRHKTAV